MKPIRTQQRYQCDFCKKRGIKSAMNKHELHCVKNPNRVCGGCDYFKSIFPLQYRIRTKERREEIISEFKKMVSEIIFKEEPVCSGYVGISSPNESEISEKIKARWEELKEEIACPSCKLSVVALSGIAKYVHYDYKEDFLALNAELLEKEQRDEYYSQCCGDL